MDFRDDINGLRALAVVAVVLFHYEVPGFGGGYVGVDVFFVISGYLMTQAIVDRLERGSFSLSEFYWARAKRIVPALFVLLLVMLVVGGCLLLPRAYAELGKTAGTAIGFVSNVLFWRQRGYFDTRPEDSWLLHTWSLSVEWQFYLAYPLLLALLHRWGGSKAVRHGTLATAALSLALCVAGTPFRSEAAFFLLPARAWEMLAGGLVYLHRDKVRPPGGDLPGIALIAVAIFSYGKFLAYPGHYALLPVVGSASIIAARKPSFLLRNPVAQWLGNTSYSVYLWHWPLVVGARHFAIPLTAASRSVLVVLSLLAASASYYGVEQVFRRLRGRAPLAYLARIGGACAALLALCALVVVTHGLPQRVPPLAAKNDAQSGDFFYPARCEFVREPCSLGPASAGKTVVWGDSHAEQLYPVLLELANERRTGGRELLLATHTGCLPVRGVDHTESRGSCETFNQRVYELLGNPAVRSVVLVALWGPYFRERVCEVTPNGCKPFASEAEALAAARLRLEADVRALSKGGKNVVVVLPVPYYERSVPRYLAERAWAQEAVQLSQSRAQHEQANLGVLAVLRGLGAIPNVEVLDPADVLCAGGDCRFQKDGVSLYRDNNHLTGEAVLTLGPLLQGGLAR